MIEKGTEVVVIDLNQEGVRKAQQMGFRGVLGDATQSEVLEHAHLHACKAVVITVPHHQAAMLILDHVRKDAPHVQAIVRSRYEMHVNDYVTAGAHVVVGDESQVGESLANHLFRWLDSQDVSASSSA
mgnify:FL=1